MKRVLLAVAAVVLMAGCTGVPSSSAPQTIEPVPAGHQAASPTATPPNIDSDPRTIVSSFLGANVDSTGSYATARAYLTSAAVQKWSTASATIIADDRAIGFYDDTGHTVTVLGRVVGTLDKDGIYTPSGLGTGAGGAFQKFIFHMVCVGSAQLKSCRDGQWKIDSLPAHSGLLLTDQQFSTDYRQAALYFYDLTDTTLIPDLRWSVLDGAKLAAWELDELVGGPRPELANAVSTDTMPAQLLPAQVSIGFGTPTRIEIPGSSHLEPAVRRRVAAEVSATLSGVGDMVMTDGANPVSIPGVQGHRFTAADFVGTTGPPAPDLTVYYLVDGHIQEAGGRELSGPLGRVSLTSVALSSAPSGGPLLVAGVVGSQSSARLYVGTDVTGLRPTSVSGALSRPSFVPGTNEVWIGDGSQVYRVNVGDGPPKAQVVPIAAFPGGDVVALRVSPEGARVAIVTQGPGDSKQLSISSIVRSAGSASLAALEPISPPLVVVDDVAWLDPLKLFGIGRLLSGASRTFETAVDGSEWANEGIGNLSQPPEYVTAATSATVWVSSRDDFVWTQAGSSWVGPGPAAQTPGTAPVYLE